MQYIPFPDISPEIFALPLGGITFALRWYALAYIVGIVLAFWLILRALARPALWPADQPPMTPAQFDRLTTWLILGVVIGGRLGFVAFYQPGYYLTHPAEILMVWQGGMSFHGGFLGVVTAAWVFARREGIAALSMADTLAFATPPGLMLGRIANFINAELWGRPTDAPWGVAFPGEAAQACATATLPCIRHPSQLYEAGLEGLVLGVIVLALAFRFGGLKRPGLIAGVFFAGYGLARGFVEFFRQPDAQFVSDLNPLGLYIQWGPYEGLTAGQTLSLPMIAFGLWLAIRAVSRARKA